MYLLISGVGWSAFSGSQMTVNPVTAKCIRRLLVLNGPWGRAWHQGCVQIIGEAYCVWWVFCAISSSYASFLVLLPHSWHCDHLSVRLVCPALAHGTRLILASLDAPLLFSLLLLPCSPVLAVTSCVTRCALSVNSPCTQTVLLQLDILGPGLSLLL